MSRIRTLRRLIRARVLLGRKVFDGLDTTAIAYARADQRFERDWLALFHRLELSKVTAAQETEINALREQAFRTVYNHCADPDLAGDVSDDFEVIGKGLLLLPEDGFLQKLLSTYVAGVIPGGGRLRKGRPVKELIAELESSET